MSYKTDMHIHSYYSDGTMKPTELVRQYQENEYDVIAITDHDGIDGVKEAKIAGEAVRIMVMTGIEFSTVMPSGIELHMLGYKFDEDNPALNAKLKEIRERRSERNEKMLKAFQEMGYDITKEDLKQRPGQTYIGKPNFARAFVKKGYAATPREAFNSDKLLGAPEIRAIKKIKIDTFEAMSLITNAGGMPVLAHPMEIEKLGEAASEEFFQNMDKLVGELKSGGLKGIECYHPSATEADSLKLVLLAQKYHLHITEGSDYHGPDLEQR